jgi:hypothetical protein
MGCTSGAGHIAARWLGRTSVPNIGKKFRNGVFARLGGTSNGADYHAFAEQGLAPDAWYLVKDEAQYLILQWLLWRRS